MVCVCMYVSVGVCLDVCVYVFVLVCLCGDVYIERWLFQDVKLCTTCDFQWQTEVDEDASTVCVERGVRLVVEWCMECGVYFRDVRRLARVCPTISGLFYSILFFFPRILFYFGAEPDLYFVWTPSLGNFCTWLNSIPCDVVIRRRDPRLS